MSLKMPPDWHSGLSQLGTELAIRSPQETQAREAEIVVELKDAAGKPCGELYTRPEVRGRIALALVPVPASTTQPAGVKLVIRNRGADPQAVKWTVEILGAKPVIDGRYPAKLEPADAHFAGDVEGTLSLAVGEDKEVFVPMAKIDSHTSYFLRAKVKDATGREVVDERPVAGFVGVPKASGQITFDGVLDEPAWQKAPVLKSDQLTQFFAFGKVDRSQKWTGPDDLSCTIRYLWDEQYLYVAVDVKDDVFGGPTKADADIWSQDGLQFLVDPMRTSGRKVGKYDYGLGRGKKGDQAWCFMSADTAAAPAGEVKDLKLAIKRTDAKTGNTVYELAFPWSRLSPFKPAVGTNLGFTLIVNEDDGEGRDAFMTWFGNAHSKDVDTVGDLILQP
jgi:hypothetical protein